MNSLSYLSLVSAKSKKRPRSFSKWLSSPVAYEKTFFVRDILSQMSNHIIDYIHGKQDIELSLTTESFVTHYRRALYMGYKTKTPSDTLTDYFDLRYMEEIQQAIVKGLALADHYQVYIPHREWMNIYEMIRDNIIIYDPDDEEDETDEMEEIRRI